MQSPLPPKGVKEISSDLLLVSVSHAVAILRGIATGYLIARFFPRTTYGEYQFALSVIGTLGILSTLAIVATTPSPLLLVPTLGIVGAMLARGCLRLSYVGCTTWFLMRSPRSPLPSQS